MNIVNVLEIIGRKINFGILFELNWRGKINNEEHEEKLGLKDMSYFHAL